MRNTTMTLTMDGPIRTRMPETLAHPMGSLYQIADELAYLRTAIANVYFIGEPGAPDRGWVLVDTGIPGSAERIRDAAIRRFGAHSRPAAIVLTHGHFDHVGAVKELAGEWGVQVYAYPLELPHLTGRAAYPPPDPTVGGGAMAAISFLYPKGPIDLGKRVLPLPIDGTIPAAPRWRWVHTPGHTLGHISLFREDDRALIAGDAFVTTRQESMLAVIAQRVEVNGPPAYFTPDWPSAAASVRTLARLRPNLAATGHGVPLQGPRMLAELETLAASFERRAVPSHGRYVGHPTPGPDGVFRLPPRPFPTGLVVAGSALALGLLIARSRARHG